MTERAKIAWGLLGLVLLSILPAISAGFVRPPGNDLLIHGPLVEGALETLRAQGWTAFQDPWFDHIGAGFPTFHHYPRLPHQLAAVLALGLGLDGLTAMALVASVAVLLFGPAAYLGARWMGLPPPAALLAGLVAVTMQSVEPFGHTALNYGFDGHGLYGQLVGMVFAMLAVPAWWRATRRAPTRTFIAWSVLAAILLSFVIRSSLPAGWVGGVAALGLILGEGRRDLGPRLLRATAVGAGAVLLSLGFLLPFLQDLGASGVLEAGNADDLAAFGALSVLGTLARGGYLDGSVPLWTLVVVLGLVLAVTRRGDDEGAALHRGAACAFVVVLLLVFGRTTWGHWIDDLPLVGLFHDRRYVVGLQLIAPWLVAATAWRHLPRPLTPRSRGLMAAGALVVAGLLTQRAATQVRSHAEFIPSWTEHADGMAPAVAPLIAAGTRIELAAADGPIAGASAIDTLRVLGVKTTGKPLDHYPIIRQGHYWWRHWLASPDSPRTQPPTGDDLFAFGAEALLVPARLPPAAPLPDWPAEALGPLRVLTPPPRADRRGAVGLVRSDLLLVSDSPELQGVPVAWHQSGAHRVGQFPTLDIGAGATPDPARYTRVARIADRDPSVLVALPGMAEAELGRVLEVNDGHARLADVRDGAWLLWDLGWHPRLHATVDGAPVDVHLLLPGRAGVRLPAGATEATIAWRVPAWRGALAASNVVLVVLGLALAGTILRREEDG